MPLTINDLTLLIELVERELVDINENIINDAEFADDYKELLVQVGVTSDNLRAEYKSQWTEDSGFPAYDELIAEIEEMFTEDVKKKAISRKAVGAGMGVGTFDVIENSSHSLC